MGCAPPPEDCPLPSEKKKRWCTRCAKGHAGAVNMAQKQCEECGLRQASSGLPSDLQKRWCAGCAKAHTGAVNIKHKKCEDCERMQPFFGLPGEANKRRWCAGCAKAHAGGVDITTKKCEDCRLKQPNYGLPSEKKRRWCAGCAKAHAGAVNVPQAQEVRGLRAEAGRLGVVYDSTFSRTVWRLYDGAKGPVVWYYGTYLEELPLRLCDLAGRVVDSDEEQA